MKYFNIFSLVFILIISSCKSHDNNVDTIKYFLTDLQKTPINYTHITNKYTVANTHKDSTKRIEWVNLNLTMLHNQLLITPIDKLVIKPYYELPSKDQSFFNDNEDLDKTYGVMMNKKLLTYILLTGNKIAAVMVMKKGSTSIFLGL